MNRAVIVSFARTPITKFRGSLSGLKAPQLGAAAIKGALAKTGIQDPDDDLRITEALMGNVVSAGIGQAPCRQAVIGANLPKSTVCTTINKVCASGMKTVMLASQMIQCGALQDHPKNALLAGGFESMSNVPHYLLNSRSGTTLGNATLTDGVIHDGLWDIYNNQHMGMCAEKCAEDYNITREEQDEFALESYRRAQQAVASGVFQDEITAMNVPQRRGDPIVVDTDEEPSAVNMDKLPTLRPAFKRTDGTVTAANASSLNDGAAAMVIMGEDAASALGLQPLARILGYGDAEQDPVDFTTSPSLAVPVAARNAGVDLSDIDYHEINEAFSVVVSTLYCSNALR
uniref:Thiolase N-terminal domain-containing protein n=1 Tax=Chaetoceros debilis TaxID=122233 RepID=A0A7S3Q834_9STRA